MMRLCIFREVTDEREQTPPEVCRGVGVRGDRGGRSDDAGRPRAAKADTRLLQRLLLREPGLFDGRLPRKPTLRERRQQRGLLAGRYKLRQYGGRGISSDLTKNSPPRPAQAAEALFETAERAT